MAVVLPTGQILSSGPGVAGLTTSWLLFRGWIEREVPARAAYLKSLRK